MADVVPEASRSIPPLQTREGATPPATPEAPKTPSVAEFAAGGEKEKKVVIEEQLRKNIRDRLEERIRIAKALAKEERPLSQMDRMLINSGDRVAATLESSNLTREDLAVSYYSLYDEAIQKFLASGKVAALTIHEGKIGEKGFGPWRRDVTGQVQEIQTTPLEQRLSSEYTRKLGFETWSEVRIDEELKSLNRLIHAVESSFLGMSPFNTVLDERLSTTAPLMMERKTGNFLRDEVFDQLMGPEGILTQRYAGKTFLELWNEDPTAALEALQEANQKALTVFAGELGQELLKSEKPAIDTALIEQQAKKLEEAPKPEEIDTLTNESIKTNEAKLASLNQELGSVEKEINELETKKYESDELAKEAGNRLIFLDKRKKDILKNQLLVKADLDPLRLKLNEAIEKSTTPEERIKKQEQAKALREWIRVVNGYDNIIDARFSQKYGDEYTRERLADITKRPDGQFEGAERIREHIFRLIDKENYDSALARKMLTDETIAKAIIWKYKIEPSQIKGEDGNLSLEKALPYLRSSQFQVGDVMRFIVQEGLRSAERGNPYLTLSEYYTAPQPELKLEPESIYREGVGEVKRMESNKLVWEGTIANPKIPSGFTYVGPLYCSAGFEFSPDNINYNLYVKVDKSFLGSLPLESNDSLPEEIKSFYDETGKLRTDRPITRIKLYEGSQNAADDALNALDGQISNELSQLVTASVGNYFLKKPTTERLQVLRGFGEVGITNVGLAGDPNSLHDYKIRLDNNGDFFIQDITDSETLGEEQELSSFFKRRLETFRGTKTSLSQTERKKLQQEFLKILDPLGREILRSQQRR